MFITGGKPQTNFTFPMGRPHTTKIVHGYTGNEAKNMSPAPGT
jgi:hypothetical protein